MAGKKGGRPRTIFVIIIVLIGAFLVRTFVLDAAIVDGRSMLPTLKPGEIVLVFKAAYGIRNPAGGYLVRWGIPGNEDIVAALKPDSSTMLVKRVHSKGLEAHAGVGDSSDSIFLLGDNSAESVDSRDFGAVPVANVLGKVIALPAL
jgi:signal peptidase I